MNAADQLAALNAWLTEHPPPSRRPLTDAEIAAEDYWASVGEQQRDEAMLPVGHGDDQHMQQRYDDWLERSA